MAHQAQALAAEPQTWLHGVGGEAVRAQPLVEVKASRAEMLQALFSQPESMFLCNML